MEAHLDEFDKKAEALLPCNATTGCGFKNYPHCTTLWDCPAQHRPAVAAEMRKLGEEIERLEVLRKGADSGNRMMCEMYHERGLLVDKLIAGRDAAYLKGLEAGKEIAGRYQFQVGTLRYPGSPVVDAIQACIDEAKGGKPEGET